jgi:hypothetical protein
MNVRGKKRQVVVEIICTNKNCGEECPLHYLDGERDESHCYWPWEDIDLFAGDGDSYLRHEKCLAAEVKP